MTKNIIYVLLLCLVFASCKQKATEPIYLKIDNFLVATSNLTQGTSMQSITEAIVYIDDQNQGVYHLPAMVPLTIKDGSHKVKIAPAVVENAISSNQRYAYTFLNAFDTTISFKAGITVKFQPKTTYRSNVKFEMIEDFENPSPLIGKTIYNTVDTLIRDSLPEDNMENGHCALFEIYNGFTMEYATRSEYKLPTSTSSETFVEINYKSELALAIGLYIDQPTTIIKTGVVTLNPKYTWSKAYINLTSLVSTQPLGTKFSLFISSANTDGDMKKVFVDNIKILHFE
jgi:hypothetical protein